MTLFKFIFAVFAATLSACAASQQQNSIAAMATEENGPRRMQSFPAAAAGGEKEPAPEDIHNYMTYHLGRWQSETTYFDAEGNVSRKEIEGNGEEVLIDGQINLHYSYNTDGTVNTAFRFYSPEDDKLYMIDVTHDGRWWVISANRGEDVFYSQEKTLADGRNVILKITHYNVRPAAFEAVAEASLDGGKQWRKFSHQNYRKIGDNPER